MSMIDPLFLPERCLAQTDCERLSPTSRSVTRGVFWTPTTMGRWTVQKCCNCVTGSSWKPWWCQKMFWNPLVVVFDPGKWVVLRCCSLDFRGGLLWSTSSAPSSQQLRKTTAASQCHLDAFEPCGEVSIVCQCDRRILWGGSMTSTVTGSCGETHAVSQEWQCGFLLLHSSASATVTFFSKAQSSTAFLSLSHRPNVTFNATAFNI